MLTNFPCNLIYEQHPTNTTQKKNQNSIHYKFCDVFKHKDTQKIGYLITFNHTFNIMLQHKAKE